MMALDELISELKAHGTVTVEWQPFASLHFPGRNGKTQARKWASEQGFVLIFIHAGDRDRAGQAVKATFYRAMPRESASPT
jgi:hypothetical protein